MITVKGTYNEAKVFTGTLEESSREQIERLCSQPYAQGAKIRMMPDVHAGAGCTIGTTMTITDKVCPNLVGVDIGCGMETLVVKADSAVSEQFDPERLDKCIRRNIPFGRNVRKWEHTFVSEIDLTQIRCKKKDLYKARRSIGTLGGGNHFIECDRDDAGNLYIVVHSGSRHLGLEVAHYYQKMAQEHCAGSEIPEELSYVEGQLFEDYINDMKILQKFAELNRKAMIDTISVGLRLDRRDVIDQFTTIHNYIDTEAMILRKGSVRALDGEKILIPINMRDGSLVCKGKGNDDWNCSAPHGAGRVMSRKEAKNNLTMTDFKKSMEGIWSTTVCEDTIDEAPMAYKGMDEIMANIEPTAEILATIKPIYSFKASE